MTDHFGFYGVGVMMPVTSRGCLSRPDEQPLVRYALPSILATVPAQQRSWLRLFLGYDSDDRLWGDEQWRAAALAPFAELSIVPVPLYGIQQRITAIWNWLARRAFDLGCEYFVPANDDMQFLTPWLETSIESLRQAQGRGLAAWFDESAPGLPTFHMTARQHLLAFEGVYYPLPFAGAHQDPWIFDVYHGLGLAQALPRVCVRNHLGVADGKPRYAYGPQTGYCDLVRKGRATVARRMGLAVRPDAECPMLIEA